MSIVPGAAGRRGLPPAGAAIVVCLLLLPQPALAQDEAQPEKAAAAETNAEPAGEPQPVTVGDPDVSDNDLRLLVKPLTRDELAIEAEAWRSLLKAKVQEISNVQLRTKQANDTAEDIQDQASEAPADSPTDPPTDAEADAEAQAAEDRAVRLAKQLPVLQEERTKLSDRLNIVVDAWEKKGGEVEEYRQYITAVSGLDLTVGDATTAWAAIRGWIVSEQGGQRWLWNLGKFLTILFVFYVAAKISSGVVRHVTSRVQGTSELLQKFLTGVVKQFVLAVGVVVAMSALEVNISPLLAAIGGAAFVIGLALQGTLGNFASGLIILGYRPFDVGDVVDAGGVSGIVDSMNLISTRIRTFDNKVMIVPNNMIANDTITNASASDTRRVDMTFGIGYDDDIQRAKTILETIVNGNELVLPDPAPVIQLHELADSSVNFICRPWVKASDYWTVYWDITRRVKEEFDQAGISIPYPQQDVHVFQESASPSNSST